MPRYTPILDFWFDGAVDDPAMASRRWFGGGGSTDDMIRERFGDDVAIAVDGGHADWTSTAHGRLALILLLDQFTRNLYRGSARAYAGDARAAALCRAGLAADMDRELGLFERAFFLMPMQHSESRVDQDVSVQGFEALVTAAPARLRRPAQTFLAHAREHRDIVRRFGRFPHRNAVLGRTSTKAERIYLEDAPRYGQ